MHIIRKLQPLFVALALIFIVLLLRSQWAELSSHTWRLSLPWLLGSALFLLLAWALEIHVWRSLLRVVGGELPYWPAVRIWFVSAIARYVPGNIWQPLSMTVMCQRRAITPTVTLTSIVFYQILALLAALPVAAVYVGVTGNWGLLTATLAPWTPWLVAGGLAPMAVFLLRPAVLLDLVNWALVKFKRPPLTAAITRSLALGLLLLAVFDWLLWGASFALLTFALQDYSGADMLRLLPHLVASYAIAYAIGFVSLLTPSGLGVREGAFYVLLAPLLGGGAITVAALAMRIWTTLGELIAAGISMLYRARDGAAADAITGAAGPSTVALTVSTPAIAVAADALAAPARESRRDAV
jgi:uncharacterized membrane protein YbhN (UPF0104 family)